jgi:iron(III) transport system permease protein
MSRAARWWLAIGWAAMLLLPWYALEDGLFSLTWLRDPWSEDAAPLIVQVLRHGRIWLAPLLLAFAAPLLFFLPPSPRVRGEGRGEGEPQVAQGARALLASAPHPDPLPARGEREPDRRRAAIALMLCGTLGLVWLFGQGFAIGARGLSWSWAKELYGDFEGRQFGLGYGGMITAIALLFLLSEGWAMRGALRGDAFVLGSIGLVVATTMLFVFLPVGLVLVGAARVEDGWSLLAVARRVTSSDIWSLGCFAGATCGTFWKTLLLAVVVGVLTTVLGTAFALLAVRMGFRWQGALRLFALLPIITPPFVVGLAIILLVGRTGALTVLMDDWLGIPPTRWIYGFPGMVLAQTLSFTPIAFLIMIGVVQGISPTMEEAALTLRASPTRLFRTITLPLMRPGLANAFLVGVLESISDLGNPVILAGNYDVLSVQIYFALVGAQVDGGRAAGLAIVLLGLALAVFVLQAFWLGNRSYTTVAGKGDSGTHAPLPPAIRRAVYWTTLPWIGFTIAVYATIAFGGFVTNVGRDHSFTLSHFVDLFSIETGAGGLAWTGGAWKSLGTTLETALIAAPLTALLGLLTAYVLARQVFAGKGAFEFITMLSFAIPGTVIGLSYIVAFNTPPVELTGTMAILVICFIFRDMPVGIRAGVAALSQIDRSLDESSLTLRHGGFATVRRVILPLIRPAIVAALVFGLVRAMTSLSAVIFLATARHNLSTTYIVAQIETARFGTAIAYSAALIAIMAALILAIQWLVGERRLGRRALQT